MAGNAGERHARNHGEIAAAEKINETYVGRVLRLTSLALLLISIPTHFVRPVRLLGLATAILFAITAARIFGGEQLLPTSAPLPFYSYPFLS
jgi:hypothetical protein